MSSWEEEHSWVIDAYELDLYPVYDEPVWETANHELIPVSRMETSHIKNCIKLIYKHNGTWRNEFLPIFREELLKRRWEFKI